MTRVAVGALAVAVPVVLTPPPASAAAPTELFISEYVEGSSQNKALEIYNGTAAGVNLADQGYNVQFFANANTAAGLTIALTGTVAPGEVFVLAQASADAAVIAVADQQNTSTSWYNGNDTVVLRKGTTVVDSLGQIASNPTTEWGSGLTSTADNTLRRKASICAGDTDPTNAFDPSVEWNGFANNTFDGLGSHTSDCGGTPPTDAAPTVASVTPVAGSTAPADTDVVVTFSEVVSAPASAFALSCAGSPVAFALTGGPTTYTLNPTTNLAADAACTLTVTGSAVSDTDTIDPPDTMAADHTSAFTVAPAPVDQCALPATAIGAVQGSGEATPVAGQQRTVRGVVIGDHEGPSPNLRGFYLQDSGDGDAATSDGIFVFNGGNQDLVSLGDVVTVTGTAGESNGQSQISTNAAGISVCGTGTVAPTEVALPVSSLADLEKVEGMLVTYPQDLYVTEHFQLGRFGQVTLSGLDRLDVPTNVVAPGAAAQALQAENNLRKIVLDDSTQAQNPDPIPFARGGQPLSADNTLRGGDTVAGLTGVMTYTWGGNASSPNAYRVRPIRALGGAVDFEPANPRPSVREDVHGDVAVGAMNLLNLFNTFTGCQGGDGGASLDCRGANTSVEFERQVAKTVAAITKVDADVLGINEIENDGYGSTSMVQELVNRLNVGRTEAERYTFVNPDPANGVNSLGSDAIKVGMLYKPAEVTPIGTTAVLNTVAFVNGGDPAPRARPSLAQAFRVNATGGTFVADVNHFKSKGSPCSVPDAGDGQGNCNAVRTRSAQELGSWLASDPTGTGEADALILGDLNSYAKEDPIRTLESAGFTNLVNEFVGDDAYSYVFDGQWGYLDHALGSAGIVSQVTGVTEYHINSDEPAILDYNTEFKSAGQIASLYAPDEFRVSDHDPIIVGLKPNSAPTVEAAFVDGSVSCGTGNASLKVTFTDRDEADTHRATVAWGDGTPDTVVDPATSPLTLAHTYARAGRYTATVTVTDSHGLSTTRTAAVTVEYTSTGILPPLGKGTTAKYGSTVPVKIQYRDCDGTVPTGIAPVVTVRQGSTVLVTGSPTLADGEWKYELKTGGLPGPGTYTVTVTVPATGQTDTATLTLRR
ncbi:ExeM/NucH family extracellular endonuclease [Oryzobacter telluris]|uniref:ExeM/NucH family extracellular endonuclease n=1 Tax=Oryzobacter telluris TaxID=3149179 RepID=UPI00370D8A8D